MSSVAVFSEFIQWITTSPVSHLVKLSLPNIYFITLSLALFPTLFQKITKIRFLFLFWIQELRLSHLNNFGLNNNTWWKPLTFRCASHLQSFAAENK